MASKKKTEKKEKVEKVIEAVPDKTLREMLGEEIYTQWQVSEAMVDHFIDKTMQVIKDKEIDKKVPLFSLVSTMKTIDKALCMKEFI